MAKISQLDLTIEEAKAEVLKLKAVCEPVDRGYITPCLELPKKYRDKYGYGRWVINKQYFRAHRLMYVLVYGKITDDRVIMHKCDNPPCLEIHHLKEGTIKDNNDDRHQKGRTSKGEQLPMAKITEKEARVIYKLVTECGTSGRQAGRIFNLHHKSIQRLLAGEKWAHLNLRKKSQNPSPEECPAL